MSDGPWLSIGDEWLNLGAAQDVELSEDEETETFTLTITWEMDRSKSYRLEDEEKREEVADLLDELLEPDELDLEEADIDVSFL